MGRIARVLAALSPDSVRDEMAIAKERRGMRRDAARFAAHLMKSGQSTNRIKEYTTGTLHQDAINGKYRVKVLTFSRNLFLATDTYRSFILRRAELIAPQRIKGNTPAARATAKRFEEWANAQADVRGLDDWAGLQRLWAIHWLRDGDLAILRLLQDGTRSLQTITSDLIRNPTGTEQYAPNLRQGVVVDDFGRPLKFHIAQYDRTGSTVQYKTTEREAKHIFYLANRESTEQTRGLPVMYTGLQRMAQLDETLDAVEMAFKLAAAMSLVVTGGGERTRRSLTSTMGPSSQTSRDRYDDDDEDGYGGRRKDNILDMRSGQVLFMPDGADVKAVQPAQPSAQLEQFAQLILRISAGPVGMPIEYAMGDYSRANFSVAKLAHAHAYNSASFGRGYFASRVLTPIYRWWRAGEIAAGREKDDPDTLNIKWLPPERLIVDEERFVKADLLRVEGNLASREEVVEERGGDYDAVIAARSREKKQDQELGITPPAAPGTKPMPDGGDESAGSDTPIEPTEDQVREQTSVEDAIADAGDALNGAQIAAVIQILQSISTGDIGEYAAIAMLVSYFDQDVAERMVEEAKSIQVSEDALAPTTE